MVAPPKRRRVKVNSVIDSNSDAGSNEMIRAMQRLSVAFSDNISEYGKLRMQQSTEEIGDRAEASVKVLTLIVEITALGTRNDLFAPDIVQDFLALQQKILARMLPEADEPEPLPVPAKAPELYLDREDPSESAIDFTVRVYRPYNGTITFRDIRKLDPALYNALSIAKSKGFKFPDGFDLPTRKQLTDRKLKSIGLDVSNISGDPRDTLNMVRAVERRLSLQLKRNP